MKKKFLWIAIVCGVCALASCSESETAGQKEIGIDTANAESVVGATDNMQVIQESASQIAPETTQTVTEIP